MVVGKYRGARHSRSYHRVMRGGIIASCPRARSIVRPRIVPRSVAIMRGFRPCIVCDPDGGDEAPAAHSIAPSPGARGDAPGAPNGAA